MIMNISKHLQGDHQSCSSESPCQQPGYVPQRKPLTMQAAISAYEAALRKTLIYKKRLGQPQRLQAVIQWYIQPQPCIDENGARFGRHISQKTSC
ncbi:hypothetical protein EMCRGX_G007224 [Ephydatia muelleri]